VEGSPYCEQCGRTAFIKAQLSKSNPNIKAASSTPDMRELVNKPEKMAIQEQKSLTPEVEPKKPIKSDQDRKEKERQEEIRKLEEEEKQEQEKLKKNVMRRRNNKIRKEKLKKIEKKRNEKIQQTESKKRIKKKRNVKHQKKKQGMRRFAN